MAVSYRCKCLVCNHSFYLNDGDGMSYRQWLCENCGKDFYLPRFALRPNRKGHNCPAFLRRKGYQPRAPISFGDIRRFSTEELSDFINNPKRWRRYGDFWDQFELEAMLNLMGCCACGGKPINANAGANLNQQQSP